MRVSVLELLIEGMPGQGMTSGQHPVAERRLATTSRNDYEANWNRQTGGWTDRWTDGKHHVLSQTDALTKKRTFFYLS